MPAARKVRKPKQTSMEKRKEEIELRLKAKSVSTIPSPSLTKSQRSQ
jgi:hypothetical protein